MAPAQPKVRSYAEWAAILDRIQADLAQSLAQTPEPAPLPPPFDPAPTVRLSLEALDGRMNALQASLDRAEQSAAETDALLHVEADTLRAWDTTFKQVREKLATWVAGAV